MKNEEVSQVYLKNENSRRRTEQQYIPQPESFAGVNIGYSQQKHQKLDFQNINDRTQSIDTLATGVDSNISPYYRMVSTITENIVNNSSNSVMFTMNEREECSKFRGQGSLENLKEGSNAIIKQINSQQQQQQQTVGGKDEDNKSDSSPIQSRSISMLQDQMFINLKKDEGNLASRFEHSKPNPPVLINSRPNYNQAMRGMYYPPQRPPQELLQALIINDSVTIDQICQISNRQNRGQHQSKNDDEQPFEIFMDDQTIRDESMIGMQSKSVSPQSPLSNNRQIEEQITNFDQYEHQLLIRQFRELRLQQQQPLQPKPNQNNGQGDSATASFGDISIYPRTFSAGNQAQVDQRTNNLFAVQNESHLTLLLKQGRAPSQVAQLTTSPRSGNYKKTVQFSDDNDAQQRTISISSPPQQLQNYQDSTLPANQSINSSSQKSARFEEIQQTQDEKQRVSSMNASAGKSGPGILSSNQQNKEETSSSDSFTSLSADIQNIISHEMPNAVLKQIKGHKKIDVGPLGFARQATHHEKTMGRGGLPSLNQRQREDSSDLINGEPYVSTRNMSENQMVFPFNDNYPPQYLNQQQSSNQSRHGMLPNYMVHHTGQRQHVDTQNYGHTATMSYMSSSNGNQLEVESFRSEFEDNESFSKLRHPSDQFIQPYQAPPNIDPYLDPATGAKMSFMMTNDDESGQQDAGGIQQYFVPNPVTQYLFSPGSMGLNDKHSHGAIRNTPSFTNNYLDIDYTTQEHGAYGMQAQNLFNQKQQQNLQQYGAHANINQYPPQNLQQPHHGNNNFESAPNQLAQQNSHQKLHPNNPAHPFFGSMNSSFHPQFQNSSFGMQQNSFHQQQQHLPSQFQHHQGQSFHNQPQQTAPHHQQQYMMSHQNIPQRNQLMQNNQFVPPSQKDTIIQDNPMQRMNSIVSTSSAHSGTSSSNGALAQQLPSSSQVNLTVAVNQMYKGLTSESEKLQYLIGNAYVLCKEQTGCRRLQKKIDEQIEKDNDVGVKFAQDMLDTLLPQIAELMMDSFANYLIQKLNKLASETQIDQLFENIRKDFVQLSTDKHGTRALQNLFKQIIPLSEYRSKLISEGLKSEGVGQDKSLCMSLNIHGNHVIQLCLDHLVSDEHKDGIYRTVILNCAKIATDKHGCCVIQKILNFKNSTIQRALVNVSLASLSQLINDQFGNYVVQQILKYNDNEITFKVAEFICENLAYYCKQKISSNVVESAVRSRSSPESQLYFYQFLLKNFNIFKDIICDQFGNYVIFAILQTAKEHSEHSVSFYPKLFQFFNKCHEDLNKVSFGKKIIGKVQALGVPPSDQMPQEEEEKKADIAESSKNQTQKGHEKRDNGNQDPGQPQNQTTFQKIKGSLKQIISGAAQHRGYTQGAQHRGGAQYENTYAYQGESSGSGITNNDHTGGEGRSTHGHNNHHSQSQNNHHRGGGGSNRGGGGGNSHKQYYQSYNSNSAYYNNNEYPENYENPSTNQYEQPNAYARHREVTNTHNNNYQQHRSNNNNANNNNSRYASGNNNNGGGHYYQGGGNNHYGYK